jgi:hypothetical protein
MAPSQTASITQNVLSPEPVVTRRGKSWWLILLPFVLWQVIALLFCESVLFCAGLGEEEIFKFDKKLGFRHFPDKLVTWRSEGFSRSYFNADGMRDPGLTIAKPANTLRIALLGDSMTESLQVPFDQSWGQLIQEQIGSVDGKKVQVVNFGNSGYSTTQECLLLEEKVFKYQPDLVVVAYSSRDILENWAPPDETLSNVRPAAMKIPGRELIIDSTPVTNWLNSPRGRFLQSIEWFRHHSRVWGIISATELQLSMKEPIVKALLSFFTNPVRSSRAGLRSVTALFASHKSAPVVPAVVSGVAVSAAAVPVVPVTVPASIKLPGTVAAVALTTSLAPAVSAGAAIEHAPSPAAVNAVSTTPKVQSLSTQLMAATIQGLFARMNKDCQQHNAKFMVIALPCRSDLSPFPGISTLSDLTYADELSIVKSECNSTTVPFLDSNTPARDLPASIKKTFFYGAHMAPPGHAYASQIMTPAVRSVMGAKEAF